METFGERLKRKRRECNLGVAEFAEKIGVTPDAVMKIESGKRGRAFERLPKMAQSLGCRIDDLFPEMDEPMGQTNVGESKTVCADGFEDETLEGWAE
ncbi:MAG: helix-turn-helix transcriptional regulator [Clostridia bacterium]|nr:helix-turn-helix transcriptional regulator [Clostridia bacterium]